VKSNQQKKKSYQIRQPKRQNNDSRNENYHPSSAKPEKEKEKENSHKDAIK
jgi:hypothetical protein